MKIGILTYHDINNFGAQLQAASIQKFLVTQGFDATLINYKPIRSRVRIAGTILRPLSKLKISAAIAEYKKRRLFSKSYREMSKVSNKPLYNISGVEKEASKYDVLICGSDELWNFDNYLGYQAPYILDFKSDAKLISYAASMGYCSPDKNLENRMKSALNKFSSILVRDNYTSQFLEKLGIQHKKVIDPTYLIDLPPKCLVDTPYILITGSLNDHQISEAFKTAKVLNLKVITPGYKYRNHEDSYVNASPLEWVGYVKNAKYHITSLFHGAAFSIKHQTPFGIYLTPGKENKIKYMMDIFELSGRLVNVNANANDIEKTITTPFSKNFTNHRDEVINNSKQALLEAIRA
jgi:hypothetical protein